MEPITREEKYLAAMTGANITPPAPVTRHEMYLAAILNKLSEGATGGGTASEWSPDWNANEGEPGYIQNRTHYVEKATLFSLTDAAFDTSTGTLCLQTNITAPVAATEYTFVWDNVPYNLTLVEADGAFFAGNSLITGVGNSEEPFALAFNNADLKVIVVDVDGMMSGLTSSTHSASMSGNTYKILAPKFLPKADYNAGNGNIPIVNAPCSHVVCKEYEWDGDTTGKEIVTVYTDNQGHKYKLCRVSEDLTNVFAGYNTGTDHYWLSAYDSLGESNSSIYSQDGSNKSTIITVPGGWVGYSDFTAPYTGDVKNVLFYAKQYADANDPYGLPGTGMYLRFRTDADDNVLTYIKKVTLYYVKTLAPAYMAGNNGALYLDQVYMTRLKLRSSNKLWEITVDDSGTVKAKEVTN